jgi:3-methyladenine DNA glycosylase AlkD
MTLVHVRKAVKKVSNSERARFFQDFFRTGRGGYGEGDLFLGLTVPQVRSIAKEFRDLDLKDVTVLLKSRFHEERLLALVMLVRNFDRSDAKERAKIFRLYLAHRHYVNNWDLVDASAPHIVGRYLLESRDHSVIERLSRAKRLWDRRIAMVATFAFIRAGKLDWTFKLAERFLSAPEDLMHKASGWMLREAGKRDERALRRFLDLHAATMPRTMLRYSLEKLPIADRKRYMEQRGQLLSNA